MMILKQWTTADLLIMPTAPKRQPCDEAICKRRMYCDREGKENLTYPSSLALGFLCVVAAGAWL